MFQSSVLAATNDACGLQSGAICWRMHRGRVEVLLITSRETGRWVIPKGWITQGLSSALSAEREAWQEAGVRGALNPTELGMFDYQKVLPAMASLTCQVQVFALRVSSLAVRFPERGQRRRKWFDAAKAARKVEEPALRRLFTALPDLLGRAAPPEPGLAPD